MYTAKRAIIMAAGVGKRMRPVTEKIPKPLIKVNGKRMINTIIDGLHANGVMEIYVVVGYLKEQFEILQKEYEGINLIENPYYDSCNNISSLYVAREHLENCIIIDGDQIIYNFDILRPDFKHSGYCSFWTETQTTEWLQEVKDGFVQSCSRNGGRQGWQLCSISFWSEEDGRKLRQLLELEFAGHHRKDIYWDDIAMFCYPEEFQLGIRPINREDIVEIDNYSELTAIDKSYLDIDWVTTLVPLAGVLLLCTLFFLMPEWTIWAVDAVRRFLGDELGFYYTILGTGGLICSLYMAFSRFGEIKLGEVEKPEYNSFKWGTMIFTSTMAADILFYSCCEWALYANEPHIAELGGIQQWAATFPLFHWGPIAWSFYIILAVAFGFMLHVRGKSKQKFSEACRPLLGDKIDGLLGKVVDLVAVFALLAGTATTFSLATPLLAEAFATVFGIWPSMTLSIIILILIAAVYTITVLSGMSGISKLAGFCSYLFFALLFYILIAGGETVYIIETGIEALGNMVQNFISMATYMDPLRENMFPQNWTIYYWAYWMAWCVATPFFIGKISKGRTIKSVVLGGYGWGLAGTFTSFIVLGNYGLAQQMKHGLDTAGYIADGGAYSTAIIRIFNTLPLPAVALLLLVITMIAFYSTTFDALTMVVSSYSYKELPDNQEPGKKVRTFWAILFILLPIALIFAENSLQSLQSVSIIAAFPIGIVTIMIVSGFFKDAKKYLDE